MTSWCFKYSSVFVIKLLGKDVRHKFITQNFNSQQYMFSVKFNMLHMILWVL